MKKIIFALLTLIMALPLSAVPALAADAPILTNVIVSPTSTSIMVGQTKQLDVQTVDQFSVAMIATTTFSSSNALIASVDNSGLITALLAGSSMIIATAINGTTTVIGTSTVTVTDIPVLTTVILTPSSTSVGIGATKQLTVQTVDQFGAPMIATTTFVSSNPSAATVTNAGLITGVISGTTTITASSVNGTTTVTGISTVTVNIVPLNLLSAESFVILSKTGITNVPTSTIKGNVGTSPSTGASIAGLGCPEVTGIVYSVDATGPACKITNPVMLTAAVSDMETAYTNAAGQPNGVGAFLNVGAGTVTGQTLVPGVYTWNTDVVVTSNLTLSGNATDVWVFQISGKLDIVSKGDLASGVKIILIGGAQAKNIYWQVADSVTLGTFSHFEGNILAQTNIAAQTGATINGRLLAQSEVSLQQNTVNIPPTTASSITAFNLSGGTSVISETNKTIKIDVPNGTNVTALVPTITITGASVSPISGLAQNFTNPVTYTVTASDGTVKSYIVTVTVLPAEETHSNGGGGGGYVPVTICSEIVYGSWNNTEGTIQYRDIVSQTPNNCSLTIGQQAARSRTNGSTLEPVTNPITPIIVGKTNYPNGTLLKGDNNKIYVVINNNLVYIPSLKELIKHQGQILKVSNSVIANFSKTNVLKVLAETNYPNGTLLKSDNNKIYVVINNQLLYIPNLKELAKHKGKLLNVSNLVITNFAKTNVLSQIKYIDGTLIRTKGDSKIYVIKDGKKIHIRTLIELKKYTGTILNV